MTLVSLSADDARRATLRAQGLLGAPDRRAGVSGVLQRLGAVQLDTISVLARSHELVAYARLGAVGRAAIEAAYWQHDAAFEYWAHAASIVPIDTWPLFAYRRRHYRARTKVWHDTSEQARADVIARLRGDGPLTITELGGARKTAQWWDWSEVKAAAEYLLARGDIVCVRRVGWLRVYDLPERVVPESLRHDDLDDDACMGALVARAGAALGVATPADIADYYRLRTDQVRRLLPSSGLVPVDVAGWRGGAWASTAALDALSNGRSARHRTTLLSPFDSLVWDRTRTARMFGFDHRLEAYVPKAQRKHGYFTMPLLAGGRLIARVDPARLNGTLVARHVILEPWAALPSRVAPSTAAVATALREAAGWVGCADVATERVTPTSAAPALAAALS
jgi:uncharacterized protein YcaQ